MNPLEQAQAKAAEAQRLLNEAKELERKAREDAETARRKAEQERVQAIRQRITDAFMAEVLKLDPTAVMDNGYLCLKDGEHTSRYSVHVNEDGDGWRSSGNSKYSLKIDGYGGKRFPMRKDGTHDYPSAASFIVDKFKVENQNSEKLSAQYATQERNLPAAEALSATYPQDVRPDQYREGAVYVKIDTTVTASPERMDAFLKAYNEALAALKTATPA
jgi:hypothetical protein